MKQIKPTETNLLNELIKTINNGKNKVAIQVNSTLTIVFWHVGKKINDYVLNNKRADYGKEIVVPLARQLSWPHFEIKTTLSAQLNSPHFIGLFIVKSHKGKTFLAKRSD